MLPNYNPITSFWPRSNGKAGRRASIQARVRCPHCKLLYPASVKHDCQTARVPQGHTVCEVPGCGRHVPLNGFRCYQHQERIPDVLALDAIANGSDQTPRAGRDWREQYTGKTVKELMAMQGRIAD
jgi:hypothetical protein